MSTTPDSAVIEALNDLIQTCKDGEKGFHSAAAAVRTPRLVTLLGQYSRQRALFAKQLQAAVCRLEGEPRMDGSLAGDLQRTWLGLRSLAAGKESEEVVIAACEQEEDAALKTYGRVLAMDLPREIQRIVRAQLAEIKRVHDRIRALEGMRDVG